tara:strand:+ start:204 stop:716 length:513 start_codon:yes stop_codon:yes gene_type:complete
MNEELSEFINAPVAGQSLTNEMGAFPWQRPPRYATIDEVIQHYSREISSPESSIGLVSLLDSGATVKEISNATVNAGVMEGLHTIDISFLVAPVVYEMIRYIGDEAKIEYKTGLEETETVNDEINKVMANKIISEFKDTVEKKEDVLTKIEEPISKGLMSRPTMSNEGAI